MSAANTLSAPSSAAPAITNAYAISPRVMLVTDGVVLTPSIGASLNVASLVSATPGNYDITFATPFPDTNYIVLVTTDCNTATPDIGNYAAYSVFPGDKATNGCQIKVFGGSPLAATAQGFSLVIFYL